MTIIIGAKTTYQGKDTVFIGADCCLCYFDNKGTLTGTSQRSKLLYREGSSWVFAHCGIETNAYKSFKADVVGSDARALVTGCTLEHLVDLCRVDKSPKFDRLEKMMDEEYEELVIGDSLSTFFFAGAHSCGNPYVGESSRTGKMRLLETSPEEPFVSMCYGSGEDYANTALNLGRGQISISPTMAGRLVIGGLHFAQDRKGQYGFEKETFCKDRKSVV